MKARRLAWAASGCTLVGLVIALILAVARDPPPAVGQSRAPAPPPGPSPAPAVDPVPPPPTPMRNPVPPPAVERSDSGRQRRPAPAASATGTPTAEFSDWPAVPIDRPLKTLGMLAGPFGDSYRSATVERLKQECLPLRQPDAPRVQLTLILSVEEHADGFLLVEATLDPEMAPLEPDTRELAECLMRTHRNLFLQVEGTTGGRRFRIPWPIRI